MVDGKQENQIPLQDLDLAQGQLETTFISVPDPLLIMFLEPSDILSKSITCISAFYEDFF